jgi:trehalose-6-phosphatase
MYICVDFDGTLVDHRYPEIGRPVPDALVWLKKFQSHGARIILYTMRSGTFLTQAVNYVEAAGITLYGVNHNPDQDSWTTSPKAYANLYIDDAAVGCPLIELEGFAHPCVNWEKVGPYVERLLRFGR